MPSARGLRRRLRRSVLGRSDLEEIIPPEIKDDPFAEIIQEIASRPTVHTALEIGSSDGSGSTQAFLAGMTRKGGDRLLACLELSESRFEALTRRLDRYDWATAFNYSSVNLSAFPAPAEVSRFYITNPASPLRRYPEHEVLRWLHQDRSYAAERPEKLDGIRRIKAQTGLDVFDAVLIDGCEFTGRAELELTIGSRYIMLDDTLSFKTASCKERLLNDSSYRLIAEDDTYRHGFAVFERV